MRSSKLSQVIVEAVRYALQAELDATPKPGLVDRRNNGSHTDMDYALMQTSIGIVAESVDAFLKVADSNVEDNNLYIENLAREIQEEGVRAELRMLRATDGVNTHKGAIYCMGLAATAYYICFKTGGVTPQSWQEQIKLLALSLERTKDTKGYAVTRKYRVNGAVENAVGGYQQVFSKFVPFFNAIGRVYPFNEACVITLLYIATQMDDTNLYVRGGKEGALWAVKQLERLLQIFKEDGYNEVFAQQLDDEFIKRNLSLGGSADMLALTLFVNSMLEIDKA
ncbi:MAG: triphosphoribosyl-dephospho-CoA synthase [Clostridia bacterium]|nr:triphosphoribosyl-dephospho-CoA synthase [Clostridia bacterium]